MQSPSQSYLATAAVGVTLLGSAGVAQAQHQPADIVDPTLGALRPAGISPLFIHSRDVRVRRGLARITVECPPLAGRCRGVLELASLMPGRALGSVAIDVDGGERRTVEVPVGRRKRRRIAPGQVTFRAGEAVSQRLVVVHG